MGRLTVLKQIARDLAFQFGPECEIVIEKAAVSTKILKLNHLSFVEVLRQKMRDS